MDASSQSLMLRSFPYHLMKQLHSCKKINEAVGKNNLKGLKDKVCGLWNIDLHSIQWELINTYNVYI